MAVRIYTDKDADLNWLKRKTCGVIGFGAQGHAHALNLRDSGIKVVIGLYPRSKSRVLAKQSSLEVVNTRKAVRRSDVVFVALPDTEMPEIYEKEIGRQLNMVSQSWDGKRLYFSTSLLARWDKGGADNEQFVRGYHWDGKELKPDFSVDFAALKLGRPHHMLFGARTIGKPATVAANQ